MNCKKKIIITGPKVHNVGYRLFLLNEAETMTIPLLDIKNLKDKSKENVEVFIGGDSDNVDKFVEFIQYNYPENSRVDKPIKDAENYEGNIRTTESFSRSLSIAQLSKMANSGIQMLKKQDDTIAVIGDVGSKLDNLGNKVESLIVGMHADFDKMDAKYDKVSQKMESIDSRMESIDNSIKDLSKAMKTFAEALINNIHNKK